MACHAMHVRLAYCLVPMHAWLKWDKLLTTMPGYETTRAELREKRGWMRESVSCESNAKCVRVESSAVVSGRQLLYEKSRCPC